MYSIENKKLLFKTAVYKYKLIKIISSLKLEN